MALAATIDPPAAAPARAPDPPRPSRRPRLGGEVALVLADGTVTEACVEGLLAGDRLDLSFVVAGNFHRLERVPRAAGAPGGWAWPEELAASVGGGRAPRPGDLVSYCERPGEVLPAFVVGVRASDVIDLDAIAEWQEVTAPHGHGQLDCWSYGDARDQVAPVPQPARGETAIWWRLGFYDCSRIAVPRYGLVVAAHTGAVTLSVARVWRRYERVPCGTGPGCWYRPADELPADVDAGPTPAMVGRSAELEDLEPRQRAGH